MRRKDIVVEKYGGDKFLWFLREGGITREPDFIAYVGEKEKLFVEFQYADKEDLQFFDFKISKVAKKKRGRREKRIPYDDRIFLYILKSGTWRSWCSRCMGKSPSLPCSKKGF